MAALKTAPQFLARLADLGVSLPFDDRVASGAQAPLAQATEAGGLAPRNRFCILPMEGWDGTPDGRPSDLTRRRWGSFGRSGGGCGSLLLRLLHWATPRVPLFELLDDHRVEAHFARRIAEQPVDRR